MNDGSELLIRLFLMLIFGGILSAVAHSKGRNPVGWFFVGFFFFCIGLIILLCLPNLHEEQRRHAMQDATNRRLQEQLRQERLKNQAFQSHTAARLDEHDRALEIDTRQQTVSAIGAGAGGALDTGYLPPVDTGSDWYYSLDDERKGPFSFEQIVQMIGSGVIQYETLVWNPSLGDWTTAGTCEQLKSHLWG